MFFTFFCRIISGLFVLLLLLTPASTQEEDITAHTPERLATTISETIVSGSAIEARLDELTTNLADIDARVTALAIESQELESEQPTQPEATDVETLQAYAQAWNDRLTRLAAQSEAEEQLGAGLLERQDTIHLVLREGELLAAWQEQTLLILAEIDRRIEIGELDAEAEGIAELQSLTELAVNTDDLRQRLARDELNSELARERAATLTDTIDEETPRVERAEALLIRATSEAALAATYAEVPEAERGAELSGQRTELAQMEEARQTRQQQVREAEAGLAAAQRALDVLDAAGTNESDATPEVDAEDGAFSDLRTAERLVAETEARIERLRWRIVALEALSEATTTSQGALTAFAEDSTRLTETLTRVVLLAEALEEPDAVLLRDALLLEQDTLYTLRQDLERLLANVEVQLAERRQTEEQVLEAEQELAQRQADAQEERTLAQFLEQAVALSTPDLITAFETALSERDDVLELVGELGDEVRRQRRNQEERKEAYEGFLNPIEIDFDPTGEGFTDWAFASGLIEEVAERPADVEPTEAADGTEGGEQAGAFDTIQSRDRARQDSITSRLAFYQQSQELRGAYDAALEDGIAIHQLLSDELEGVVAVSRQIWGSAAILRDRQLEGGLSEADTPAQLEEWVGRDLVIEATSELAENRAAIAALEQDRNRLVVDGAAEQMIAPLSGLQINYTDRLQALASLTSFDAQLVALENPAGLDEVTRSIIDKDVRDRIESEHGFYGLVDNFISSQRLVELDQILSRFYERLILLERQQQLIDDQIAQVGQVRESMDVSNELYVALLERVSDERSRITAELDRRTTGLRIALNPVDATDLREAYRERTGEDLPVEAIPVLPEGADEEARADAVQATTAALRPLWALSEGYGSWAADLGLFLEPLGRLDTEKRQVDDLLVALGTQNEEIMRRVQGLIGISREALSGDSADQELTVDQRRLLAGEIGTLRFDREAVINSRAIEAGVTLLIIPVTALILILVGRLVSGRFFQRLSKDDNGVLSSDRARRADTLSSTVNTIWTVLVVALALIYMLGTVNVDVTPILASLGVFGLAFAFGAQTIVKDVLSGLFLLMENQFNVGERVVVNGVTADVERIGMRITTVRERSTGLVHYISNGQIMSVANFNREFFRVFINVVLPYEVPPQRAVQIIEEEIEAFKLHSKYAEHLHSLRLDNGVTEYEYSMGAVRYAVRMEIKGPVDDVHREFRRLMAERLHSLNIPMAVPIQIEVHEERTPVSRGQQAEAIAGA